MSKQRKEFSLVRLVLEARPAWPIGESSNDQYTDHMTRVMNATEVKAKILALLEEVAAGEEIEITKRGRTVARLVPAARDHHKLKGSLAGLAWQTVPDEQLYSTGETWECQD